MNITTVAKLTEKHDGLTEGGVRWDIFNASKNGLAEKKAIIRKGRRVLLVEELYLAWLGIAQYDDNAARRRDGRAA